MMSLDDAEAEFVRLCKEISQLEKRLRAARTRAEKLTHYIEIAREKENARMIEAIGRPPAQSKIVKLRRRRRTQE